MGRDVWFFSSSHGNSDFPGSLIGIVSLFFLSPDLLSPLPLLRAPSYRLYPHPRGEREMTQKVAWNKVIKDP